MSWARTSLFRCLLAACVAGAALLAAPVQAQLHNGRIASRGPVLRNSDNSVGCSWRCDSSKTPACAPCEESKPTWVEYNDNNVAIRDGNGGIIFNIPDDVRHQAAAFVMSTTDYKRMAAEVLNAVQTFKFQARAAAGLKCLQDGTLVDLTTVASLTQAVAAATGTFNPKVRTVIVREDAGTQPACAGYVLFASPLNVQALGEPSGNDKVSMLLDQETWSVLYTSKFRIGLETSLITFNDSDKASPNCVDNFEACRPGGMWASVSDGVQELRVWSPISGVTVEIPSGNIFESSVSDGNGYYQMHYRILTNPIRGLYQFPVTAKIIFQNNNPRSASANAFTLNAFAQYDAYTGTSYKNFDVDVSLLSGSARLTNIGGGPDIRLVGITKYETARGIVSFGTTDFPTVYDYQEYGYNQQAQQYTAPGFQPQGLLKQINVADLRDTEIYVYRMANGQLVGSRWGLLVAEVGPTGAQSASAVSSADPAIRYSALMRGPHAMASASSPSAYQPPNALTLGSTFDTAKDFLRVGELVKVVAINRATGYIGTALGQVSSSTGQTTIVVNGINMRPPNLRVKVERTFTINQGADKSITPKTQIIGFEGSGLNNDQMVTITTEWFDQDGQPLPEDLPGYTGRLAHVVSASDVGPEAVPLAGAGQPASTLALKATSETAMFSIRPNRGTAVIRLPQTSLDVGHFYLHVAAEPKDRNVTFTGAAIPAKPNFSVNQVCYSCGDIGPGCQSQDASLGQGGWSCVPRYTGRYSNDDQALAQRPVAYVPFKAAIFRKDLTDAARQAALKNLKPEPDPIYDWIYRPEMQFSLLSLEVTHLYRYDPHTIDVLNTKSVLQSTTGTVQLIYNLKQDPNGPLPAFGPARTLAFSLQGKTQDATFVTSPEQETPSVVFTDVNARPANMSPADMLTIRLVQRGDEGNPLWEYKFNDIQIVLEDGHKSVPIGESVIALANTQPPNQPVKWKIVDHDEGVKVTQANISGNTPSKVRLTADEESKEGFIVLRATMVDPKTGLELDNATVSAKIFVGCECKACNSPGGCGSAHGSVHTHFTLGEAPGGGPAGYIFVETDVPTADTYTPKGLSFSTLSPTTIPVYDVNGLRQVSAPETFVDIVKTGVASFELRFYPPSARGQQDANTLLYAVNDSVARQATWTIDSPSGPANQRFRISGQRADASHPDVREYDFIPGQPMKLITGSGLKNEERTETIAGPERSIRVVTKDNAGVVASVTDSKFRTYAWGEELVEQVQDPLGAALTTTKSYYETIDPSLGAYTEKVASVTNPDGSWVRYSYDEFGRVVSEVRSWLDAPVTAPESQARVLHYGYDALDPADTGTVAGDQDFHKPRTTTELIQGIVVSKTFAVVARNLDGSRTEIEERCTRQSCHYGDADNLRTETRYYAEDATDPENNDLGRMQSVKHPDGTLDSYSYERGSIQNSAFVAGAGDGMRTTITHGTVALPDGVPYKSTRDVSLVDDLGNGVLDQKYVYTGSSYELIAWTAQTYVNGRLVRTDHSDGEYSTASWGCCSEDSTIDTRGIKTEVQARDSMERVLHSQRAGITTSYTYDGAGRQLSETRSGGGLSLYTSRAYDSSGRVVETRDESGLISHYDYFDGGRTTTVTHPGAFTERTDQYLDGQHKSTSGTAIVPQYFSYAVNADGTRVTEVRFSRADSPVYERTTVDMVGRTTRVERPGFAGGTQTTQNLYNVQGQLQRNTTTGLADTFYAYDELGRQVRNGLDVNGNGHLDFASADRITESDSYFNVVTGQWWQEQQQRIYADAHSSSPIVTSTARSRLTGLGGGLISEEVSDDLQGNETRTVLTIDPSSRTETRITDVPDSTQNVVAVSVDGRLKSSTDASGITMTYDYDGLGRRFGTTDPRTGRSQTNYDPVTGRVISLQDAANNTTTFGYEASTGRKIRETNALGKNTYFEYNARGEVVHTWGDVPYPAEYVYDEYGRRTDTRTFRGALAWNGSSWPTGASLAADTTHWTYEEATGLLTSRVDAAGKAVQYSYDAAGRLKTRTWARPKSGGGALTTTYSYDFVTGELLGVDYNDSTPDVSYAYDRLGRQTTVTDGEGSRTFAYNPTTLQLASETIIGIAPAVLTQTYDTSVMKGRSKGFSLGGAYTVSYDYDPFGRFNRFDYTINGAHDTGAYAYAANSTLLASLTTQTGQSTAYTYDAQRNLKTQLLNKWGSTVVSQYDYVYDAVGRRTSVKNSGPAFTAAAFNLWTYDDRNELATSDRYLGTVPTNTGSPVTAQARAYQYDPIGNRQTSSAAGTQTTYAANALNEYTAVAAQTRSYDDDGNLLNDGTKLFTYNAENQLLQVAPVTDVNGSKRVTFVYDYGGRRVKKTVETWSGSSWSTSETKVWVYSGWNKVQETKTVGGSITKKNFVWGLDLSQSTVGAGGIGGLVAIVDQAGVAHLINYDGNGNVSELLASSNGTVNAHYEYDAFGNVVVATGPQAVDNCYRFSTKYQDDETGLIYYGYRYLDTGVGRWIRKDPAEDGLNWYAFVLNEPIEKVDLLGLFQFGEHHSITTAAFNAIDENGCFDCLTPEDKAQFFGGLMKGSLLPDKPEGLAMLADIYLEHEKLGTVFPKSLTYQSHFGTLQYLHSMANGDSPDVLRDKILGWIGASVLVAEGSWKRKRYEDAGYGFGAALHTIQDSYSRSHVSRDASGAILIYQDYNKQDPSKHAGADTSVLGQSEAERASTRLLRMAICLEYEVDAIRERLEQDVFVHAAGVKASGTDARFAK